MQWPQLPVITDMPRQCRINKMLLVFLGKTTADSDDKSADTVATQVVALTYQSQMTASMAVNLLQQAEQQFAHLASQKKSHA
jgi:hypothetical protein